MTSFRTARAAVVRSLTQRTGVAVTALNTAGGVITVNVGGQLVNVQVDRSINPATTPIVNGDIVLMTKVGSTWFVTGLLGTATLNYDARTSDPAPDVRPGYRTGRFVIHPVDTATYRASVGWREDTTDLFQGDQSGAGLLTGAAFYGTKPSALAGATVTKAVLKLKRLPGGPFAAATPVLKLVTEAARPTGAPTLSSAAFGPALRAGDTNDYELNVSWGQGLVNGTYGGLAITSAFSTPYLRLAGRDSWAAGMVVVLDWRRDG